jgi:hypothetical protein
MAVERSFLVKLLADPKQLIQGFSAVKASADDALGSTQTKLQGLVPGFQKVAAASAVAFAGLTTAAGFAISAAVEAQAEQNRLRQILITTGGATEAQVKQLIAQADALEKVGVASAGNIQTAQAQLATFDLQFETIQRLTPAITDYVIAEKGATASAEDFKSMTNALAQALQGNFGALTKSGFVLDDFTKEQIKSGTEAERSAALVEVLNSTYEGFNETARDTAEGQMVALRNSFNAVRTEIGTALLPAFEGMIKILQGFADFLGRNTQLILGVGIALGVFTGIIVAASVALKVYAIAASIATAANTAFGVSLSATGIGAIVVLIGLLVAGFVQLMIHSEKARNVMKTLINITIAGFEMLVNAVIGVINSFIDWGNVFNGVFRALGINIGNMDRIGPVAFGRLGDAANKAAGAVNNVSQQIALAEARLAASNLATGLVSVADAENKLAVATGRVNQLRAQALKGGTSIEVLNQAIKDQSDAQSVLNALTGNSAKTTGGASRATAEAIKPLEAYTKVLKDAQGASKSYESTQRRVRDTQKSLTDANKDLVDAQQALLDAQQAGSPAEIADAQRAVAAAERGVTRGKFAQEQSLFAVADAERKLREIREKGGATAQEIREAEIALEEAKLRVVDQEDDQIDSARKLEEARRSLRIATEGLREGDKELVPIQDAVTRAQEAQTKAAEQATDALNDQTEAVTRYKEALDELATAIIKFPKVSANVGQPGLIPLTPPSAEARRTMPDQMSQAEVNMYINAGMGVDGPALGQEILEALRDYERVYGPLNLAV